MTDAELAEAAGKTTLFARLSPAHKQRIIQALQSKGHVVGFLGDGINDAPALRAADVGISVDTAVDIAKEAADIILLEKSLHGARRGRAGRPQGLRQHPQVHPHGRQLQLRQHVQRAGGQRLPAVPAHGARPDPDQQSALRFLAGAHPRRRRRPRADRQAAPLAMGEIARFILFIGPCSSIFDYTTYFIMLYVFRLLGPSHGVLFQTGWFVESLLTQTLIIHVIRTNRFPSSKAGPVGR